jgi:glycine cleavage system H protein
MRMYPEDLKYAKSHEWVRVEGDIATVGISQYAAEEMGDVVFIELPDADAATAAGESMGSIESVKTVVELTAPVTGTVVEANEALADTPETVNESPYGDGWMVKIKLANPAELDDLMDAAAYAASLEAAS